MFSFVTFHGKRRRGQWFLPRFFIAYFQRGNEQFGYPEKLDCSEVDDLFSLYLTVCLCLFSLNCSPGALTKSEKGNPPPFTPRHICPDCSEQRVPCASGRPFSRKLISLAGLASQLLHLSHAARP